MNQTEHAYIEIGRKYEKAKSPSAARSVAHTIRGMLDAETIEERTEARRLIEQGRAEARTN